MKKIFLAIILVLSLFIMTGCKKEPVEQIEEIDFSEIYPNNGTY